MTSLYITESGTYLRKKGGHVVIGRNNEVLLEVPIERIEDITLIDSVHVSSALLTEFLERNIPMSWMSGMGKFYGSLISNTSVDVLKHQKQFELLDKEDFYFRLGQKITFAKIHNQLTILRRYNRNINSPRVETNMSNILAVRKNVFKTSDYRELMGYEGIISRIYFDALGDVVSDPFKFEKRTKRPPRDPVNSMLSLGYSMLFNEILTSVISVGLHPYVGFLHRLAKGHPALVSDLMEEWRAVLIDSLVLAIIKRNMIGYDMFEITNDGCFLNSEGRKIFLHSYNKKLRSVNQYLDGKYTFRESIKQQCRKYASALMHEDIELYVPVELR